MAIEIATTVARAVIVLFGLYLLILALAIWFKPNLAKRFLGGLVHSAGAHYLEVLLRLVVGLALLQAAPHLLFTPFLQGLGWVLLLTTLVLLVLPWRWHQRFAQWSVPKSLPYLGWIALASFAGGVLIIVAVAYGSAS